MIGAGTRSHPSPRRSGAAPDARRRAPGRAAFLPILIISAGILAYLNSFAAVFLFDDKRLILDAERIRQLWPPWSVLSGRRPVVDLSLAVNYAIGELNEWGYHAFNLTVHILAALTLFGIVRRTRWRSGQGGRDGNGPVTSGMRRGLSGADASAWFAFVVAIIFVVHPLQTQSVTYIIQRGESLMGLFYLLTLYGVVRGAESSRGLLWYAAAVVSCALGMGSKAVMVTAPLMALLYDRAFLAGSFSGAIRRRWGLYTALAATWTILALCGVLEGVLRPSLEKATVGFSFKGITPIEYALTEAGVLAHYLRLSIWPNPLCLDYDWPVARTAGAIVPPVVMISALVAAVAWALRRRPALGFVGAWFFVILAPTSGFVPIADPVYEHRMYLSLASVAVVMAAGGHITLFRLARAVSMNERRRRLAASCLVVVPASILGLATARRNADYRSELAMWRDVTAKRPHGGRGNFNLGNVLAERGDMQGAIKAYRASLRMYPRNKNTWNNMARALRKRGKTDEAVEAYRASLRIQPSDASTHNNLGNLLKDRGDLDEAIEQFGEALQLRPDYAEAYCNRGLAYADGRKDYQRALADYNKAIELDPDYDPAYYNRGIAYFMTKRYELAIADYGRALALNPNYIEAYFNRARACEDSGRIGEALADYREFVQRNPLKYPSLLEWARKRIQVLEEQ